MAHSPADPVRVGIVGAGQIAINHATALLAQPRARLVAVCDTDRTRAAGFATQFGIDGAFDDLEEMLGSGLDAITVCTPHPAHEQVVLAAARHGRHVLCEKPVAVTLPETDRMIAATRRAGVKFGVLFQRRRWPAVREIRRALDSGALGPPIAGHCHVRFNRDEAYYSEPWRGRWDTEGGGALLNQGIHHIDILQWFLGEPVRVSGQFRTLKHGDHIEVEDTAAAVVEFASGAIATLQVGTTYAPALGAQVLITDARGQSASFTEFPEGTPAYHDIWAVGGELRHASRHTPQIYHNPPLPKVHHDLAPFHAEMIHDFVEAIVEDRDPLVTGEEARKSLAIVLAIYESTRTGRGTPLTGRARRRVRP